MLVNRCLERPGLGHPNDAAEVALSLVEFRNAERHRLEKTSVKALRPELSLHGVKCARRKEDMVDALVYILCQNRLQEDLQLFEQRAQADKAEQAKAQQTEGTMITQAVVASASRPSAEQQAPQQAEIAAEQQTGAKINTPTAMASTGKEAQAKDTPAAETPAEPQAPKQAVAKAEPASAAQAPATGTGCL